MKLSTCCNADMIYLGGNDIQTKKLLGDIYNYCCSKCGGCEWNSKKERCKFKWYKFDKNRLEELLKGNCQEKVQT